MKSRYLVTTLTLLALSGCGGSGGSNPAGDQQPTGMTSPDAVLGVLLTDAPSDDVEQVIATFKRIELVGPDQTVVVFEGAETVDLLELPDAYELFTVSAVPAGTYDLVRIEIGDVKVVTRDESDNLIETPVTLPAPVIDVMLVPPVTIAEGAVLFLEIDFDVNKALERMHEEGGDLILEPVIFVEIDDEAPQNKITRIHGEVSAVTDTGFRICDTQLVSSTDSKRRSLSACADVAVDELTTYFGPAGTPILMSAIEIGDPVTVVGHIDRRADRIPAIEYGHLPPPGECRLWYLDREPGQQPPPAKCETFEGMAIPENAVLVNDQGLPVNDIYGIDALVLEVGSLETYRQYRGKATTSVIESTFNLLVEGNQGIVTDAPILTRLYPETRIFSADGVEQDPSVIQPELKMAVDGVLALSDMAPDEIRAAFILVKLDDDIEMRLSGTVLTIDGDTLTIATDMGDRCVDAGGSDVFLVSHVDGHLVSEKIELSELVTDQAVDVFGFEATGGCFEAETILADGGGG